MKRILLVVLTNVVVMGTIGVLVRVLGLDRFIDPNGAIDWVKVIGLSLCWGFTGSVVSLLVSKPMAKWNTGARIVSTPQTAEERWLVETVTRQAQRAGIGMPDVAIYESPEVNAFATGAFRNSALVAVSRGLLQSMEKDEVEAVLAHEVSHVANGDMVTMTLLQGVVNSVVVFVTLLIRIGLSRRRDGRGDSALAYGAETLARLGLTFLGSLVCAAFSRRREYRADAGAASLESREAMIRALERLGRGRPTPLPGNLRAMGISGGMGALFATHPPLEARIRALQAD